MIVLHAGRAHTHNDGQDLLYEAIDLQMDLNFLGPLYAL